MIVWGDDIFTIGISDTGLFKDWLFIDYIIDFRELPFSELAIQGIRKMVRILRIGNSSTKLIKRVSSISRDLR